MVNSGAVDVWSRPWLQFFHAERMLRKHISNGVSFPFQHIWIGLRDFKKCEEYMSSDTKK